MKVIGFFIYLSSKKILPPAIITVGVSVVVLFLSPMELQARLTSVISGITSLVFLSIGTGFFSVMFLFLKKYLKPIDYLLLGKYKLQLK